MPSLRGTREEIPYEIVRSRRRTIGLTVHQDGRVEVRAPHWTSAARIREMVQRHEGWIAQQRTAGLERVRRLRARRFENGEDVPFQGAGLRLRVIEAAQPAEAERIGDELLVVVRRGLCEAERATAVRAEVGRWLIEAATEVFHAAHVAASRRVGEAAMKVTIKEMRSRWGSCGPERRMSLNWRLVMAPPAILDYVLVHELTHIAIPDHSRRFWAVVAAACPGYRAHRRWLENHGADLVL